MKFCLRKIDLLETSIDRSLTFTDALLSPSRDDNLITTNFIQKRSQTAFVLLLITLERSQIVQQ